MKLIEGENARYCKDCDELKHFNCFNKDKNGKYGLRAKCKACTKVYQNKIKSDDYLDKEARDKRDLKNKKKECTSCGEYKSFSEYGNHRDGRFGLRARCRKCKNKSNRRINKKNEYTKNGEIDYKELYEKYEKKRLENDPSFRIKKRYRSRVYKLLKGINRSENTEELVGCSWNALREYIKKQFEKGMSWNNYGVDGWHIDHIIPCSFFNLDDPKQQKICFHYSNLQPLWYDENISKSDKIPNLFKNIEIDKEFLNKLLKINA